MESLQLKVLLEAVVVLVSVTGGTLGLVAFFRRNPTLDTQLARLATKDELNALREQMHNDNSTRTKGIYDSIRELGQSIRAELRADREGMQKQINEANKLFHEKIIDLLKGQKS